MQSLNSVGSTLSGKLLLASPELNDGIFYKAVIYLEHHSLTEGAIGILLNSPTTSTLGERNPELKALPLKDVQLHLGGPVDTENLTYSSLNSGPEGLVFQTSLTIKESIDTLHSKDQKLLATAGYSGWVPGQLEDELENGLWIPLSAQNSLLKFALDTNLWKHLLRERSPAYKLLAEHPRHPEWN